MKAAPVVIKVGLATCGIAAGADKVFEHLAGHLNGSPGVELRRTGCLGMCFSEPNLELSLPGNRRYIYGKITPEAALQAVDEYLENGRPADDNLVYSNVREVYGGEFLSRQHRIVLRNCGVIDPENIKDYIQEGGYQAIKKAVLEMTPDQVIEEIKLSGLRGRGGAGFPTGMKWSLARANRDRVKYIICNADEGDPGAFMDRSVLESDPHSVIEGMLIAGYAIGASEGYIYARAEYPLAVQRLKLAIAQAKEHMFLGERLFGSGFSFDLKLREGAGAFVCGEETALIMSVEGKRGMPKFRPPFPAESGLWGHPTIINNVETLANVAFIIQRGASAFNLYGTEKSKGTKVFALAGKIKRGGLVEVPMGITINEIVFDIGGGIAQDQSLKAVQTGGPSGGCIPAELCSTPIDYDSLARIGSIMGSGGLLVMDETTCMVDVAKFFLNFTQSESCGKCTFCRVGTRQMKLILDRITEGQGDAGNIATLEELAAGISQGSLCGLGQTAPNPVLTTLKYFRDEYEKHILDHKCPAKKCRALLAYEINSEKCTGCGLCSKNCPAGAISGNKKEPHAIDPEKCIRCGLCMENCKFDAVTAE